MKRNQVENQRKKMFKLILGIFFAVFQYSAVNSQVLTNAYTNTITDISGKQHSLQDFQAKKIWLVILPSAQNPDDTAFLARIDSIGKTFHEQIKTIAVPSYEDGYYNDTANTLISWYQESLDTSIIISKPLYTHLTSDSQQDSTFRWLTHSNLNSHFDTDVSGPGTMFFIDTEGNLIGVFGRVTMWNNQILNLMLH
jgi:hypothetical protein